MTILPTPAAPRAGAAGPCQTARATLTRTRQRGDRGVNGDAGATDLKVRWLPQDMCMAAEQRPVPGRATIYLNRSGC